MLKWNVKNFQVGIYHKEEDKEEFEDFINGYIEDAKKIDIFSYGNGKKELFAIMGKEAVENLQYARTEGCEDDCPYIVFAYAEDYDETYGYMRTVIASTRIENNQIIMEFNEDFDVSFC